MPIRRTTVMGACCCATPAPICFVRQAYYKETSVTIDTNVRPVTIPARAATLADLLQERRSVRKYQDRPVPRAYIEQIIEAARWAPSPHGRQPWRFVVITRPDLKTKLAAEMGQTWQRNLEMDGQNAEIVNIRLEKSRQRIL